MKKVPLRTCLVTREVLPQKELFRIVKTKEGIKYDSTYKLNGRGAYLKKERDVILKAEKNKIIEKALKEKVDDSIYREMLDDLN